MGVVKHFSREEIIVYSPKHFGEARDVADEIKMGKPALINVGMLNPEERIWAIHFLNGVIYAIDGQSREISPRVFLFCPPHVAVSIGM
jgi:FtsZ-interacting cell division protein YlmF